jgi:DNA-directed RNA polymerase specialized sigma24 family protein
VSSDVQGFAGDARDTGSFHTTRWGVVREAGARDGTRTRNALASLCATYWYPLYVFIRRQGCSAHEAEDLTQEFFYRFLQGETVQKAQPSIGKFRSFLLSCLKKFLINERVAAGTQRRGGGEAPLPLQPLTRDGETRYLIEPADTLTPEATFDRRWAFAVLDRTMADLRREYSAAGKRDVFEDLQGFLPNARSTLSRPELAAKRNISASAIDVAVHRLRQRFGALLRREVARTVSSDAEIDDEIRYLISVLSG